MQSHYQAVHPLLPLHNPAAAAASSLSPLASAPLSAAPSDDWDDLACCDPGHCCARSGSCPCFCSRPTLVHSLVLIAYCTTTALLIVAQGVPDYFEFDRRQYWTSGGVSYGAWQSCIDGVCSASTDLSNLNSGMFQAFRSLLVLAMTLSLASALLLAWGLWKVQRGKVASHRLSVVTSVSAAAACGLTLISFALSCRLPSTSSSPLQGEAYGVSFYVHMVAVIVVTLGLLVHLLHLRYGGRPTLTSMEEPMLTVPAYPILFTHSESPNFSHPAPSHTYYRPVETERLAQSATGGSTPSSSLLLGSAA